MKAIEKPIVIVIDLKNIDVLTASPGISMRTMEGTYGPFEPDNDYRKSGSRDIWGDDYCE